MVINLICPACGMLCWQAWSTVDRDMPCCLHRLGLVTDEECQQRLIVFALPRHVRGPFGGTYVVAIVYQ